MHARVEGSGFLGRLRAGEREGGQGFDKSLCRLDEVHCVDQRVSYLVCFGHSIPMDVCMHRAFLTSGHSGYFSIATRGTESEIVFAV